MKGLGFWFRGQEFIVCGSGLRMSGLRVMLCSKIKPILEVCRILGVTGADSYIGQVKPDLF